MTFKADATKDALAGAVWPHLHVSLREIRRVSRDVGGNTRCATHVLSRVRFVQVAL